MRVALLADIHGNCFALDAVLTALADEAVDQIVCLGDVAIFGPQPHAALARVRALGCSVVMGNTDAWALDPQPHPARNDETPYFNAIELWGAAQLTDEDRAYIRTFAPTVTVDLGGAAMLCYHGSPRSFDEGIYPTMPDTELSALLGGASALVLAGGHIHEPFVRRYQPQIIVNPGSVGLPYERLPNGAVRNPPWAEYAVVTWRSGDLQIDLRRVGYDAQPLLAFTRATTMPYADWWLQDWDEHYQ